ncbi:MAG: cohesin domain-containing protein [Oscillospiraceae bacterium]|nr:cohesin domain-containing protein [Oscillospiraceae bacterium]
MKINKVISCMAAAGCAASMLGSASVFAADSASDFSIGVKSVSIEKGADFSFDVVLENVPADGIVGLDFAVKYDSTAIKVNSITEGAASKTGSAAEEDKIASGLNEASNGSSLATNVANGEISALWATGLISTSQYWIKNDGVLFTVNCTATGLNDGDTSEIEIVPVTRKGSTSVDAVDSSLKVINPAAKPGTVTVGGGTTEILYGDVDGNGVVEMTDLTMLSQRLIGDITLTEEQTIRADVIINSKLTLEDLSLLKQYILKEKVTLGVKA